MITAGIDLSTQKGRTWAAVIEWHDDHAHLTHLLDKQTIDGLLDVIDSADKAGIDCPFGWPDAFVDYLQHHRTNALAPQPPGLFDIPTNRATLARRHTDRFVTDQTKITPLAVSADRIALTAMHCADILAAHHLRTGHPVDRTGTGKVVEVYPAASLARWGLKPTGYKTKNPQPLRDLRDGLLRATGVSARDKDAGMPRLRLHDFGDLVGRNDDAFDAVIAALTARAAALPAQVLLPSTDAQRAAAMTEGWIHLPAGPLTALWPAERK